MKSEELALLVVRTLDQSKKVRITLYERLLDEKINFEMFSDSDRLSLVKNGLTDPD